MVDITGSHLEGETYSFEDTPFNISTSNHTKLMIPTAWCEKSSGKTLCSCEEQEHDIIVTDITHLIIEVKDNVSIPDDVEEYNLAEHIDWWTEGVILPVIGGVGILGRF